MWSQLKNILIYALLATGLCVVISGCGFQPVYGDHSVFADKDSPISGNLIIDPINSREGQIFKTALEDRLNPEGLKSAQPEYRLQVSFTKSLLPTVVKSDGTIERYNVRFDSKFNLISTATGKAIMHSDLSRIGSYNVTVNANFATYEAEQDVIERTLQEMAEDYAIRLSSFFAVKQ